MDNTARDIIDALGRPAILDAHTRITERGVIEWRAQNSIPAIWFDLIEAMCIERGIACPRSAFTFRTATEDKT